MQAVSHAGCDSVKRISRPPHVHASRGQLSLRCRDHRRTRKHIDPGVDCISGQLHRSIQLTGWRWVEADIGFSSRRQLSALGSQILRFDDSTRPQTVIGRCLRLRVVQSGLPPGVSERVPAREPPSRRESRRRQTRHARCSDRHRAYQVHPDFQNRAFFATRQLDAPGQRP